MAGYAGHPGCGPKAGHALTFNLDHLMGAGQMSYVHIDHCRFRSC
jgi:hypothetical protein